VDEMKDFRHPEQSARMIIRMAKDIIDNLGNELTIASHYSFVSILRRGSSSHSSEFIYNK
jgi:hypothetical protein